MNRIFTLLLLSTVIAFGSVAQTTVQIGTGSSVPANTLYSPVYRFSATSTTTTAQSNILFTAAEMTTAGIPTGASITAVEFNKTTAFNFITPATFTMRMGNTTATAPLTGTIATQWATILATHTQVYTSSSFNIPAVTGWAAITLATPFVYTGGSLEISTDMVMGGNGAATGNFAWEYTAGFDTYIIGATSGNSNLATYKQRPNIKITYTSGSFCSPPSAPVISNITDSSATGTWTAASGSVGYEYDVTTSATPPASGISTASLTQNVTGLTSNTQYYFHLRNACAGSLYSTWVTTPFMTPYPPCDTPSTLVISNITDSSATGTWTAAAVSTGYQFAVNTLSTPPVNGVPTAALSQNVTGLSSFITYYFHVRNVCVGGMFSPWLTTSFYTLHPPCIPPSFPVISNISANGATLTWNPVTGSAGYEWSVTTTLSPPASGDTTSATTVNAAGLTDGTTYFAHIRNNCGPGGFSPWATNTFNTLSVGVLTVGNDAGISVYPNPVKDVLIVEFPGEQATGKVILLDLSGQLIKSVDTNGERMEIDMRDLSSGVYVLKYMDASHDNSYRIVKE